MDLNSAQRIADAEAARTGLGTGPNRRLRLTLIIAMPLFLPVLGLMILVPDGLMNDVLYAYQAVIIGCLLHYLWVFVKYPRHEDRPPYLTRDLAMGGGFFLPSLFFGFWPGMLAALAWALFVGITYAVEVARGRT
ncbi:hypothetical protein ACFWJV_28960 [Streptomyces rochei]|jgi:hypothetical protein|uniref:Uncharacterized protein n=1 Tax=Streptomyces rochei TaxID=1928 RepID=A0ABW7DUE5_STRRO|nr:MULTISPECIES: hypothetical protein [Streptomyces]GGY86935.1 hypothetical protein GCM10010385_41690 [Streptomyces geysiriensis]MBU8551240.1 hypothetical protein [Streptomyces sp. Osf17]MBU8558021.1 hypothetical protein [Streptomyces sp. Babs14]MDI3097232.1 hypothetical protein [Streptomyces sp. AN-3]QCB23967.1 hypothetical protein E5N77_20830 [Streptomyces sp. SS52]